MSSKITQLYIHMLNTLTYHIFERANIEDSENDEHIYGFKSHDDFESYTKNYLEHASDKEIDFLYELLNRFKIRQLRAEDAEYIIQNTYGNIAQGFFINKLGSIVVLTQDKKI